MVLQMIGFFDQEKPHYTGGPMHELVEVFCDVDDFWAVFIPEWEKTLLTDGTRKRQRAGCTAPTQTGHFYLRIFRLYR